MNPSKREINEYLFYEFGLDAADSEAKGLADDWPFELFSLGQIGAAGKTWSVYRFIYRAEEYYVLANGALNFLPVAGMDVHGLAMQLEGQGWIGNQDPVGLDTVEGPESQTPAVPERRAAIAALIRQLDGDESFEILEGLYLKGSQRYLAFVRSRGSGNCHVVSDRLQIRNIPFPDATPWRRLALAIGKLVRAGDLTQP